MNGQCEPKETESITESQKEIRRINDAWVAALIRGDVGCLNSFMNENCVFTYALEGEDRTQFLAEIQSGALRVDSLKRDNVEVRVYDATGVMIAFDTADWIFNGRRIQGHYRTMHVYSMREGRWEIVAIQASPISSS